jgi:hypothetical protein
VKKIKLNQAEKRALSVADVANFMRQYGRRRQKGAEPNDRRYDRELEASLKKLDPSKLDGLMRDDEGS